MYKMKRLIALVMACLISIPVLAKREIHFAGDWNITRKSINSNIPIKGNIEETTGELTLEFAEDLGDIVVTVTDASGKTVYQETVTTGNTPTWTVFLDESVQNGTVSITDGINLVYGEINF